MRSDVGVVRGCAYRIPELLRTVSDAAEAAQPACVRDRNGELRTAGAVHPYRSNHQHAQTPSEDVCSLPAHIIGCWILNSSVTGVVMAAMVVD